MSQYLYFTKPDGSKVRVLKGTVIEFDLWVGAANTTQISTGVANEITEKAQIIISDTWQLKVCTSTIGSESFFDADRTRFDLMLLTVCMTQILKHCEAY